ncbi:MAG TPA: flagellar M-ring protein FliF [Oceanospirillaceae bacterium]|nr:flagellar M-ring protein FliF [Oceanospirillaceae bacterium]
MAEATMNSNALPAGQNAAVEPQKQEPKGIWAEFMAQPAVRRSLPLAVMAFGVLIMVVVYMALQKPAYRPMFPGMDGADQAAVYDALTQAGVAVELDTASGAVKVPVEQYHEAKLLLANQGLPATPVDGFAMIRQQQAMGTSQFMEQKRYQLAIEEELANSISSMQSVKSARVHLAMPKQSVFVRNRVPTTASVVVNLAKGRKLNDSQAQAIVHMVASSIPYLDPANVSVVDQYGNLVMDDQDDSGLGLNEKQLGYRNKVETMYQQRIQSLLGPLVGADRFRAEVNADMDFTVKEMTQENYNPETIAVRSEQISEKTSASAKEAAGIPGSLSNEPPAEPTLTANQTDAEGSAVNPNAAKEQSNTINLPGSRNSTRNYEVDRTIAHTKLATGDLQRLSISVVIDEPSTLNEAGESVRQSLTPEQIQQFTLLVQNAVGFSAARGDIVSVVGMSFQPEEIIPQAPLWEQSWLQELVRQVLLAVMGLVFILVVLRPVVKNLLAPVKTEEELAAEATALAIANGELAAAGVEEETVEMLEGETLEDMKARLRPKKSSISPEMLDTANSYDDKVALMRMLIAEDSKRVAGVMSSWVKQDF